MRRKFNWNAFWEYWIRWLWVLLLTFLCGHTLFVFIILMMGSIGDGYAVK